MTDALKAELIQRARDRNLLVVVGTGVSLSVTGNAPLASWKGLITDALDHCVALGLRDAKWAEHQKQLLDSDIGDLLSAAEQVSQRLGWGEERSRGDWSGWLRNTVGTLRVQRPELIEAIRNIGVPIATLNYDSLLSEVTGRRPLTWQEAERWLPVLEGKDEAILHLHGHWDRPSSVVLGIRSYDAVLGADFAQHLQQALTSLRSLAFLGCSGTFVDPNFTALIDWMSHHLQAAEHRHYLLLRRDEEPPLSEELLRKARVFIVRLQFLRELTPTKSDKPAKNGPPPDLRITPISAVNHVHFGSEKYVDNGRFSATVTLRLMSMHRPFWLLGFEMHYAAADGCYCLNLDQDIWIGDKKVKQASNLVDLEQPFDCGRGLVVTCRRQLYPPLLVQQPVDCDEGDVRVRASVTWDNEPTLFECFFRFEIGGDLVPISAIRETPLLSDTVLQKLETAGKITASELERASALDAVERFHIVAFPEHKKQTHLKTGSFMDVTDELRNFLDDLHRRAVQLDEAGQLRR